MNFSEAAQRYLELKLMLENRQIDMAEFERQAQELRVLSADNAWWQIRPSDGVWFRWDGQSWIQESPPESSFDRPTELAFEVGRQSPQNQEVGAPSRDTPASQVQSQPQKVLRIFRGQPALDLLITEGMIREIYTGSGKQYQVVNPRPSGSVQGIAFRISTNGYLDPDVAVQATITPSDGLMAASHTPAQGSPPLGESRPIQERQPIDPLNPNSSRAANQSMNPIGAPSYSAPSPRFQIALDQFTDLAGQWLPNAFELQIARQVAGNLGGVFERDLRQLEIPALGPLAGEALSWWHTILNARLGLSPNLIENSLRPIAQQFILLADQPPLYLATSRLQIEMGKTIALPVKESGLPLSAIFSLVLSNPAGLDDLSATSFPPTWTQADSENQVLNTPQSRDDMRVLMRGAAYNRLKSSLDIARGLAHHLQGQSKPLPPAQRNIILQEILENAQKTIDQLGYSADPYLLAVSHLQIAGAKFDLAIEPENGIAELRQHTAAALGICAEYAASSKYPALWLNTQFIPWALVLLTAAAVSGTKAQTALLEIEIEAAAHALVKTYELQSQKREKAVHRLFTGRAVLAVAQQLVNSPNKPAVKTHGIGILNTAIKEFILAGDLHLAGECRQLVTALG